jgi:hypothetical protein
MKTTLRSVILILALAVQNINFAVTQQLSIRKQNTQTLNVRVKELIYLRSSFYSTQLQVLPTGDAKFGELRQGLR